MAFYIQPSREAICSTASSTSAGSSLETLRVSILFLDGFISPASFPMVVDVQPCSPLNSYWMRRRRCISEMAAPIASVTSSA